ncbi:MAG: NHLP bacteriocin system secretion protein [Synechococcaceae cyanobacterium]|nr:NHLP bacteriocin system secretion protein [Synechococcaceae cyanobacterium]
MMLGSGLLSRWHGLSDHSRVGLALLGIAVALGGWALFWPIPTEVSGLGVLIYPDNAWLFDARSAGQVRRLAVQVGDRVRRGQVLMELHLPVLERELQQQRGNLTQLERQNRSLERRDALRLESERQRVAVALAKLADDRQRYGELQRTFASKLRNLDWLSRRQVVAPLSAEVVSTEQGLTNTSVNLDAVRIQEKTLLSELQQVKLAIETDALDRRYRIGELRRQIRVTEARLAYEGRLLAERDGRVLDLQVIPGQTLRVGQRLGTIGRTATPSSRSPALQAVAYFAPADARRLPLGLPVEVVPEWKERSRFGGIVGRVRRVLSLPASEEDVATTTGNPQLARTLLESGPALRVDIELLRDPRSLDGYRWTLSRGSGVFPVREGLTVTSHAYVEWRSPLSSAIPGLRSLTGGYRSLRQDRQWNLPFLRQP